MGDDGKNTTERTWVDNLQPQKKRKVEVMTPLPFVNQYCKATKKAAIKKMIPVTFPTTIATTVTASMAVARKAYKRRIIRDQLKEDWVAAGAFIKAFNGEYENLKFGQNPKFQPRLYNKSCHKGSPIPQAIINKLKGGRVMGHCTTPCNLNNKLDNPEEYYDGNLHVDLDGGILAHGLNPFCTV